MLLVLWDLDRTLLQVPNISRAAFAAGFERVTGTAFAGHPPEMAGRTDRAIITEMLQRYAIPPSDPLVDELGSAIGREYAARAADVRRDGMVLPGAVAALRALAGRPGVHQGVVTGNMHPIAQVKTSALGLDGYLDEHAGGFGMDHVDRHQLVARALARAAAVLGTAIAPADAVIIGDTPLDVRAARDAGTRVVAVATGASTRADLRAAGAATVLDDLTDTAALLHSLSPR